MTPETSTPDATWRGGCPPDDLLARRLVGQVGGPQASLIDGHVETCPSCQSRLESLVADTPRGNTTGPSADFLSWLKRAPAVSHPDELPRGPGGLPADAPPGYELLGELGRGGMGVVYKARQTALGRECALKMILSGGHAGAEELSRFRTEAEAIARLQHPGIVQVFEYGTHGGLPFLALELCTGGPLHRRLTGTPLPPAEAAALVRGLGMAVQAAHEAHVVHRDLKPANILLAADGTPKITDFGLARKTDEDGGQTRTGAVMGTPSYMAPEQARGVKDVGPAADVYALGAILYECLTGRPPFRAATSLETMQQVAADEPVPPRRLNPAVPRDLETITLKCLEKPPAARYVSARELAEDLERFLADEPIRARPVGRLEAGWRWARRNPRVALLGAAVAMLLLLIAGGAAVSAAWLYDASGKARNAEAASRDRLWGSLRATARAGRFSRQPGQRFASLAALREAAVMRPTPELRDEAIACLALADVDDAPERPAPGPGLHALDWLGDDKARTLTARRGGDAIAVFTSKNDFTPGRLISPDGKFVAVVYPERHEGPARVEIRSIAPDTLHAALDGVPYIFHGWAEGGRVFFHGTPDGTVRVIDPATGRELRSFRPPQSVSPIHALHPDGRRLLLASREVRGVAVFDLATGKMEAGIATPATSMTADWHPSGRRFALGSAGVSLFDYPSGRPGWTCGADAHNGLYFLHDGATLLSTGWKGLTHVLDAATGDVLLSRDGPIYGRPRPDGLAPCVRSPAGHLRAAGQGLCRTVADHGLDFGHPADFSPDGRLLAAVHSAGVTVHDAATALPLAVLPIGECPSVRFSPDGASLHTFGAGSRLQSWPIRLAGADARIGPPKDLGIEERGMRYSWISANPSGKLAASLWTANHIAVIDPASPEVARLVPHHRPRSVALSPCGRYVAAGPWHGSTLAVHDLRTGKECLGLASAESSHVAFDPAGRWLVAALRDRHSVYRIGEWSAPFIAIPQASRNIPAQPAFSGDGRFLALRDELTRVRLLRADNLAEVAILPSPGGGAIQGVSLDAQGRRLFMSIGETGKLWDLEGIRAELADMGLAFDWPEYARASPPTPVISAAVIHSEEDPVRPAPLTAEAPLPDAVARALADKLDGPEADAALARLSAAGKAALPAVESAVARAAPSRRAALQRARLRLESAWMLAPLRAELSMVSAARPDAVAEAKRALTLPLSLMPATPAGRRVSMGTGRVALWEAFDRFLDEAGLTPVPDPPAFEIALREGPPPPRAWAGPFHLMAADLELTRSRPLTGGAGAQVLRIGVKLRNTPTAETPEVGALRVVKAVDDRGRAVPGIAAVQRWSKALGILGSRQEVMLNAPEEGARRLAELRLALPVRVRVGREEQARCPLPSAGGTPALRDARSGHWLAFGRASSAPNFWSADVSVFGPAGWTFDPARHAVCLAADGGASLRLNGAMTVSRGRAPHPQDLLGLSAAPGWAGVPWAAFAPGMLLSTWSATGSLSGYVPDGFKPARVTLERSEAAETELPFSLRDLPLP